MLALVCSVGICGYGQLEYIARSVPKMGFSKVLTHQTAVPMDLDNPVSHTYHGSSPKTGHIALIEWRFSMD
jgi:hypothetical protein